MHKLTKLGVLSLIVIIVVVTILVLIAQRDIHTSILLNVVNSFAISSSPENKYLGNLKYPIPLKGTTASSIYFLDPQTSEIIVIEKNTGMLQKSVSIAGMVNGGIPVSGAINDNFELSVSLTDLNTTSIMDIDLNELKVMHTSSFDSFYYFSFTAKDAAIAYDSQDNYYYWNDFSLEPIEKDKSLQNCRFFSVGKGVCDLRDTYVNSIDSPASHLVTEVQILDNRLVRIPDSESTCYSVNSEYEDTAYKYCGAPVGILGDKPLVYANGQISTLRSTDILTSADVPQVPSDYFQNPDRTIVIDDYILFLLKDERNYILMKLYEG